MPSNMKPPDLTQQDEFYRNQFETGTSCGALDDGNVIRKVQPCQRGHLVDDSELFGRKLFDINLAWVIINARGELHPLQNIKAWKSWSN